MRDLADQKVVVVGASSGIGLAASREAATQGAKVIMVGRSRTKLDRAAAEVGGAVQLISVDMLDQSAVDLAVPSMGAIDHLVLSAVTDEQSGAGRIVDLSDREVEHSFNKLRGYVNFTRAAVPKLKEHGSITLLSGAGALKAPLGSSIVSAANGSIVSFGRALALELAPIRVNVVMPGPVDTPLHGGGRERVKAWTESLPARHFGQPVDIARAIVFLLTNPYVTGHTLIIDGGYLAT